MEQIASMLFQSTSSLSLLMQALFHLTGINCALRLCTARSLLGLRINGLFAGAPSGENSS